MKLPVVSRSIILFVAVAVCAMAAAFVGGAVTGKVRPELMPGTAAASPAITPDTSAAKDPSAIDAALNYSVD